MIHNFKNTEIWKDKVSNAQKLSDGKLASTSTSLVSLGLPVRFVKIPALLICHQCQI